MLLAGCGGSEAGGAWCPHGSLDARTAGVGTSETAYLTAAGVAADDCGERVVFEFRDAAPGYRVEYLPPERALVEDGSGNRIEADGEAFLVVRLEPARTAEADADGELTVTYAGPKRIRRDGTRLVRELVKTGDFEAVVTWVVALADRRPFSVDASDGRITVQIERT